MRDPQPQPATAGASCPEPGGVAPHVLFWNIFWTLTSWSWRQMLVDRGAWGWGAVGKRKQWCLPVLFFTQEQ